MSFDHQKCDAVENFCGVLGRNSSSRHTAPDMMGCEVAAVYHLIFSPPPRAVSSDNWSVFAES